MTRTGGAGAGGEGDEPLDGRELSGEQVARRIGQAIALGQIGDGVQLPPLAHLAAQLEVGESTLQDALAALRRDGLLDARRAGSGSGYVRSPTDPSLPRLRTALAEMTVQRLREIGDQHRSVSGTAALLAAQRATGDDLAALRSLPGRLADSTSAADRGRADSRFHIDLAAAAQSTRLTRQEIALQAEVGELLWMPSSEALPLAEAVAEHRAILQAVEDGEPEQARQLAEQHVLRGIHQLMAFHRRIT